MQDTSTTSYYFFIGTVAELIKLFPVMIQFKERGQDYKIIASGQNDISNSPLLNEFNLGSVDIFLSEGIKAKSAFSLFIWFIKTHARAKKILKDELSSNCVVFIHGDTVSTVMGAWLANKFKARLAHIEAGLRSFNFLNPFPEEIDRVLASKYVDIAFCPNEWAVNNLAKRKKMKKVNTHYNTLIDALRYAVKTNTESEIVKTLSTGDYFIFVLHRNENLANKKLIQDLVSIVTEKAKTMKCLFILHHVTEAVFENLGILDLIKQDHNIMTTGRLTYFEMMKVLKNCQFILTDGGSNQEECYYLGKPCCILRKTTERIEGIDENVLISKNDISRIKDFVANYERYKRDEIIPDKTPSQIIFDSLQGISLTSNQ